MELNSGPECTEGSGVKNHRYEILLQDIRGEKKGQWQARSGSDMVCSWAHLIPPKTTEILQWPLEKRLKYATARDKSETRFIAFNWVSFFATFSGMPHKTQGYVSKWSLFHSVKTPATPKVSSFQYSGFLWLLTYNGIHVFRPMPKASLANKVCSFG